MSRRKICGLMRASTYCCCARSTLARWMRRQDTPIPHHYGEHGTLYFWTDEVDAWMDVVHFRDNKINVPQARLVARAARRRAALWKRMAKELHSRLMKMEDKHGRV